jgi:hypothetical protein
MQKFAKGIPRLLIVAAAMGLLATAPVEALNRGPKLCLWSYIFHLSRCPACGSTRALAAFFHGQLARAMSFNRNVVVTGPLLIIMFSSDLWTVLNPRFAPALEWMSKTLLQKVVR